MTMNDLERRNSPYFAFFSPNSIAFLANYVFSFYLYCLSVCLYVSCVCLWALLPDFK